MSELLVIDGPDGRWPGAGEPLRSDAAFVAAARAQHEDPSRLAMVVGSSDCCSRASRLGVRVDHAIAPLHHRPRAVRIALARAIAAFRIESVRSFGSVELVQVVARAADGLARCEHMSWRTPTTPPAASAQRELSGRIILIDAWPGSQQSWTGRSIGMFGAILHRLGGRATIISEGGTPSLAWAAELLEGLAIAHCLRATPAGPPLALVAPGDIALLPVPFGPEGWLGAASVLAERCREQGAVVVSPVDELSTRSARSLDGSPRSAAEACARVLAPGAVHA